MKDNRNEILTDSFYQNCQSDSVPNKLRELFSMIM